MFVNFCLEGTSNTTTANFTLPNNSALFSITLGAFIINNGGITTNQSGRIECASGSATINVFRDNTQIAFTASGSKRVQGQFFIRI